MRYMIKAITNFLYPVVKFSYRQKHLHAIRVGFVNILPLVLIGAIVTLVNNLPLPFYQEFMSSIFTPEWKTFGGNIWNGTFAILSFVAAFSISSSLAKSYKIDSMFASITAFSALIIVFPGMEGGWGIPFAWSGFNGLFVAIIVALGSTEIFVRIYKMKIVEKLKFLHFDNSRVLKAFESFLPCFAVLIFFSLLTIVIKALDFNSLHQIIFIGLQKMVLGVGSTYIGGLFVVILTHLLWFIGIHGGNSLGPILESKLSQFLFDNITSAGHNILTKPFLDAFIYMGGAGMILALVIAIFFVRRKTYIKSIGYLGLLPALFNTSEIVTFGFPIIFNFVMLIPFVLVPILAYTISYFVTVIGVMPVVTQGFIWTTPPLISGYIATGSFVGVFVQIVNLAIGVFVYYIFVRVKVEIDIRMETEKSLNKQ